MFIHGARAAVLRVKREGSSLGKWMSGLETRTARNVVIVATANKLARISWAVLATGNDYQPLHKAAVFSTRRSDILNSFLGSLQKIGTTKTQSNEVPENLWRNEVFHDRGDYQGQARADHHRAPGDHSPLRGRIHFRRLFSSKPILLAVRRRTIHVTPTSLHGRVMGQFGFLRRSMYLFKPQSLAWEKTL